MFLFVLSPTRNKQMQCNYGVEFFNVKLVINEMSRAFSAYGGEERCVQGFSGET